MRSYSPLFFCFQLFFLPKTIAMDGQWLTAERKKYRKLVLQEEKKVEVHERELVRLRIERSVAYRKKRNLVSFDALIQQEQKKWDYAAREYRKLKNEMYALPLEILAIQHYKSCFICQERLGIMAKGSVHDSTSVNVKLDTGN